jgi:hypothetical protein
MPKRREAANLNTCRKASRKNPWGKGHWSVLVKATDGNGAGGEEGRSLWSAVRGGRRPGGQVESLLGGRSVSGALFGSSLWTELFLVPTAAHGLPNNAILRMARRVCKFGGHGTWRSAAELAPGLG